MSYIYIYTCVYNNHGFVWVVLFLSNFPGQNTSFFGLPCSCQEAAMWEIGTASLMVNLGKTPGSVSDSNHAEDFSHQKIVGNWELENHDCHSALTPIRFWKTNIWIWNLIPDSIKDHENPMVSQSRLRHRLSIISKGTLMPPPPIPGAPAKHGNGKRSQNFVSVAICVQSIYWILLIHLSIYLSYVQMKVNGSFSTIRFARGYPVSWWTRKLYPMPARKETMKITKKNLAVGTDSYTVSRNTQIGKNKRPLPFCLVGLCCSVVLGVATHSSINQHHVCDIYIYTYIYIYFISYIYTYTYIYISYHIYIYMLYHIYIYIYIIYTLYI